MGRGPSGGWRCDWPVSTALPLVEPAQPEPARLTPAAKPSALSGPRLSALPDIGAEVVGDDDDAEPVDGDDEDFYFDAFEVVP